MKSVAIVGCGPAGLSTAIALHDAGLDVCIFEQFDEPKPIGSGLMLQPTGLEVLARWGLREQVESLGQRIDGMLGKTAPQDKVVLDIAYSALNKRGASLQYGVAIHRASLFHVLYNAAIERGIQINTGVEIHSLAQLTDKNHSACSSQFDFIVDASGSHSKLAESIGNRGPLKQLDYGALWTTVEFDETNFDSALLEQRYQAASTMVGVLSCGQLPENPKRLATLFWSIHRDQYDTFKNDGLSAWKQAVNKVWPATITLTDQITQTEQLTYATYSHHTLKKPYAPGVVFVGDSAHATSPQLGQGVNMAMMDAFALSKAVEKNRNFDDIVSIYTQMRSRHVKLYQTASSILTPFYQSDSRLLPAIRDTFFEPVSGLPFASKVVASLGSGLLTQPMKRIDSLSESFS